MWISGFLLRAARENDTQQIVDKNMVFHRGWGNKNREKLSTEKYSTFHSCCGILTGYETFLTDSC